MALATTDVILTDAIEAITIAVGHTTVDVGEIIRETTSEITVAIADVVHRHQDATITVATTF